MTASISDVFTLKWLIFSLPKVTEGGLKELTAAILDAVDLDAPPDTLTLTVSRPPGHGTLINGIYGLQMSRYKDMGQELLRRSLPAYNFTLRQLREGHTPHMLSYHWQANAVMFLYIMITRFVVLVFENNI